jgi:hypothetical protein
MNCKEFQKEKCYVGSDFNMSDLVFVDVNESKCMAVTLHCNEHSMALVQFVSHVTSIFQKFCAKEQHKTLYYVLCNSRWRK